MARVSEAPSTAHSPTPTRRAPERARSRQRRARYRRRDACAASELARGLPIRELSWRRSAGHRVHEQVHTHPKRCFVQLRRVVIDVRIFPSISEIAREAVIDRETIAEEDA